MCEQHSLSNPISKVSYWELKVGVTLYYSNQSSWSSAKQKRMGSLVAWLILDFDLPNLPLLNSFLFECFYDDL